MEHAQCTDAGIAIAVNYHPAVRRRIRCVILNVHAHGVRVWTKIWLGVHRFRICITKKTLQHKWCAQLAHDLRVTRRLSAWCNLPATTWDCGGYMRGMQSGRLGEERNFLVVPVNEDMARRGKDIGGATLQKKVFNVI